MGIVTSTLRSVNAWAHLPSTLRAGYVLGWGALFGANVSHRDLKQSSDGVDSLEEGWRLDHRERKCRRLISTDSSCDRLGGNADLELVHRRDHRFQDP